MILQSHQVNKQITISKYYYKSVYIYLYYIIQFNTLKHYAQFISIMISDNCKDNEKYIPKEIDKWEDLETNANLLRGIYANGFEKPSPIQQKAICSIFDKKDIIAQAQSGTGKQVVLQLVFWRELM